MLIVGGSDVEDGDNSDDAIGGGDDNTVGDNEEDGRLIFWYELTSRAEGGW